MYWSRSYRNFCICIFAYLRMFCQFLRLCYNCNAGNACCSFPNLLVNLDNYNDSGKPNKKRVVCCLISYDSLFVLIYKVNISIHTFVQLDRLSSRLVHVLLVSFSSQVHHLQEADAENACILLLGAAEDV